MWHGRAYLSDSIVVSVASNGRNSQVSFRRCTSDVLFTNLILELRSFVNKESFLFALKYTGKQLDRACTAVDLMK